MFSILDLRGESLENVLMNFTTWKDRRNLRDLQDKIIFDDHIDGCRVPKQRITKVDINEFLVVNFNPRNYAVGVPNTFTVLSLLNK